MAAEKRIVGLVTEAMMIRMAATHHEVANPLHAVGLVHAGNLQPGHLLKIAP